MNLNPNKSNPNSSGIADPYDLAALDKVLAGTAFAGQLRHLPVTESTNAVALEAANAGAESGSVYFADEQTAGRGRSGHQWHSSAGDGLYVSVLLRPRLIAERALLISLAVGLAAQAAIQETTGFLIDIRWPNDLMLTRKKCGGILVETAVEATGMMRHAVIGIGINVNHATMPAELAAMATSLRIESGRAWPRQELLVALLRAVGDEVTTLESSKNNDALLQRFATASSWVTGKQVKVEEAGVDGAGGYTGITAGLNAQGLLQVRTASGLRTVLSGGVREL
jgi:BirA family biotin operon repressor/biotin-[acetyl-CoA-carboxylase] ligase